LTAKNIERGIEGEDLAVSVLEKLRYKIVQRNYRTRAGEIDIVAREGECLVFVEVRTRASIEYGWPQETVIARKQKKLCKAARWYLQKNRIDDVPCRFDVVAIVMNEASGEPQVEVIKSAFRPEKEW